MIVKDDSLAFVILGDWNRLYCTPNWLAQNVFENERIEISITNIFEDNEIHLRCNDLIINPSQSKIVFKPTTISESSKEYLCNCINRFIRNSFSPSIKAYGINTDYEDNASILSRIVDNMEDNKRLISSGCEIKQTVIEKTVTLYEKIYNIKSSLKEDTCLIHINNHVTGPFSNNELNDEFLQIDIDDINNYLEMCWKLLKSLGYEKEDYDDFSE